MALRHRCDTEFTPEKHLAIGVGPTRILFQLGVGSANRAVAAGTRAWSGVTKVRKPGFSVEHADQFSL